MEIITSIAFWLFSHRLSRNDKGHPGASTPTPSHNPGLIKRYPGNKQVSPNIILQGLRLLFSAAVWGQVMFRMQPDFSVLEICGKVMCPWGSMLKNGSQELETFT